MSLAAAGRMRRELCTSLVCIDTFDEYTMSGRLYHNSLSHEFVFKSFTELIIQMEKIFNALEYPQATMTLRSFEGSEPAEDSEVKISRMPNLYSGNAHGELATFRIMVMYRQNASWQGLVDWVEQEKQESFRSVLELLNLINSTIPADLKAKKTILQNKVI